MTTIPGGALYGATVRGRICLSEGIEALEDDSLRDAVADGLDIPSTLTSINFHGDFVHPGTTALLGAKIGDFSVSKDNPDFSSRDGALCGKVRSAYEGTAATYSDKGSVLLVMHSMQAEHPAMIPEGVVDIESEALSSQAYEGITPYDVAFPSTLVRNAESEIEEPFIGRVEVAAGNPSYASYGGVLYSADLRSLLSCPGGYRGAHVMAPDATSIAPAAFRNRDRVTEVVVSQQVDSIPSNCFLSCGRMVSCYVPARVESVGKSAFGEDASALKTVYYGGTAEAWKSLRDECAGDDTGNGALRHAEVVTDVSVYGICDDGLSWYLAVNGILNVQVDAAAGNTTAAMDDYAEGEAPWSAVAATATELRIAEGVTSVGANAFGECTVLKKVVLPVGFASVGANAFDACPALADAVCQGGPFECEGADFEARSFPATMTVHYPNDDPSWVLSAAWDADASTWNGYRTVDDAAALVPVDRVPVLAGAQLGQSSVLVGSSRNTGAGSFVFPISLDIIDEQGNDLSRHVSVQVRSPERAAPLAAKYAANQVATKVLYDAQGGTLKVGGMAPEGDYEIEVAPIAGESQGNPVILQFAVMRAPEYVAEGAFGKMGTTNTANGWRGGGPTKAYLSVDMYAVNQYGEDITEKCSVTVRNMTQGKDVTNTLGDYDLWVDGKTLKAGHMAVQGDYRITYTANADGLTGSANSNFSLNRNASLLDVPYRIGLSGGDEEIWVDPEDGTEGAWATSGYRTRVLDAYDDPCWPDVYWSVAGADGSNAYNYFKVDAQGFLFVKSAAAALFDGNTGSFTVKAVAGAAQDTASLTVRVAEAAAPATHTATFKAGGEVVAEVAFAEGDSSLEEPGVPQRENYIGAWEDYDLASATGDIEVNAVYTPIDPDAVSEVEGEATADYDKSVVTINLAAAAATRQVKVESESTKPVDVVMVLDQSGSMADALGAGQTKRDALVECANSFAQQLYDNAAKTGADHRVALVGFAYSAYNNGRYKSTGLLAGAGGAKSYAQLSRPDYAGALLPIKGDGGVNPAVTAGIDSIVADGATAADVGLKVAKNVFSENPVATTEDGTPARERIVVFITDGVPTSWGQTSSLVRETAAEAILMARDIKQGQGARVYSVGVDAAADPAAAFNGVADGVVTGARDAFKSYDFNRFLHAVSSDYPAASGMADLGDGAQDAGYYMAVNDTSSLGKIFRSILYSTVYSIETFDRAALSYTLPDGFVLTMKQEEEMRAALAKQGLTDDDIVVAADGGGKTTVTFKNVKVSPETVDGVVKYVARVSFQVTADKDVSGSVSAGSASIEQNGEMAAVEVPAVEVPGERCLVVFKVNDAVYEIREASIGDEIELPDTNLARWLDLEKMQEQGTAQVSGAYAVFETSTLSRSYNVAWAVGEQSVTTSFKPGEPVAVPDEVRAWVPEGFELAGWSPALPATMPARNISATAVLTPEHVHDFSHSSYRTGSCDEGIVTHHVCACGEEATERAEPKAHDYEAVLSSGGMYGTTVEKLVCRDCGHSVDKRITYSVSRSSFWNATVLDLSKYEGEVVRDGASDDDISLRFYVGDAAGKTYTVTRIDADGRKTSYTTRVENGYLTFDPDHFSIYVVGEGGGQDGGLTYEQALEALGSGELPEVTGDPESVEDAPDVIDISGAAIAPIPDQEYDGAEKRPAVSVSLGGETLPADGYDVDYAGNVNAGTASVTVAGRGDYEGTATATFEIKRKPVTVRALDASKTYGEADPALAAEVSGLVGSDSVSYALSREPGEAARAYAIAASGEAEQGNYLVIFSGATFTVSPKSIQGAKVELVKASYTYDGAAKKPTVKTVGGAKLVADTDYKVTYSANKNAGKKATVIVEGRGNYAGKASTTFTINLASIKGAKLALSKSSFTYNKKAQRPTVKTVGGKALKAGTDYDLKYSNAKSTKAGSYTVQAVGKGNYAGASAKATYRILNVNPVKVTAEKPSVSLAKVRRAKQVIAAKDAFSITGNRGGKVTYKKASGDKALAVASNGKVTVAKGAKKGPHTVKVKVSIAAKGSYAAFSKTVTLKVTVK